jgi:hypothetical protein
MLRQKYFKANLYANMYKHKKIVVVSVDLDMCPHLGAKYRTNQHISVYIYIYLFRCSLPSLRAGDATLNEKSE